MTDIAILPGETREQFIQRLVAGAPRLPRDVLDELAALLPPVRRERGSAAA